MRKALTVMPDEELLYNQILNVARDLGISPPSKLFLILGKAFLEKSDVREQILTFDALASRLGDHYDLLEIQERDAKEKKRLENLRKTDPAAYQRELELDKAAEEAFQKGERTKQQYIAENLQKAYEAGKMHETLEQLETEDSIFWDKREREKVKIEQ